MRLDLAKKTFLGLSQFDTEITHNSDSYFQDKGNFIFEVWSDLLFIEQFDQHLKKNYVPNKYLQLEIFQVIFREHCPSLFFQETAHN